MTCGICWPRRVSTTTDAPAWRSAIFCYRVQKYVGAYLAAMFGAEAVVFAGGVGESPAVRQAKLIGFPAPTCGFKKRMMLSC